MAIIKGRIRGCGRQLAAYLLSYNANESIRILDVDGQEGYTEQEFRDLLGDFSLNERLTKSSKGIYHATYNPSETIAAKLTDEQWLDATSVLIQQLGFEHQRRAVVLHKNKAGRNHIHIAVERYQHEAGKMIPIPHNYRKHDKARAILEQMFEEQPTAKVNPRRREMKAELTRLWNSTADGKEFITAAKEQGYMIAKGHEQGQFVFVDQTGQSFKLSSHLKGVRVGMIRERFKGVKFIAERDAVAVVKNRNAVVAKQEAVTPRQAFIEQLSQQRKQKQNLKPRI